MFINYVSKTINNCLEKSQTVNKDENKEENHILAHFLPTDESIE
jgi:hypothetical protein